MKTSDITKVIYFVEPLFFPKETRNKNLFITRHLVRLPQMFILIINSVVVVHDLIIASLDVGS
jgi:hypothetical protein